MAKSFTPSSVKSLSEIDRAEVSYGVNPIVIQGVVSPRRQRSGRGQHDDYRIHYFSFAAWRRAGEKVHKSNLTILRAIGPTSEDYLEDFPEHTLHQISVLLTADEPRAVFLESMALENVNCLLYTSPSPRDRG